MNPIENSDAPKLGAVRRKPNDGKGRPVGTKNKTTVEIKEMILQALNKAGGIEYLVEKAKDPRSASAFLTLLGKVLPMQVTGEGGGPVLNTLVIEYVKPDKS